MSILDDVARSGAARAQLARDLTANYNSFAEKVASIDPNAPDAKDQIAALVGARDAESESLRASGAADRALLSELANRTDLTPAEKAAVDAENANTVAATEVFVQSKVAAREAQAATEAKIPEPLVDGNATTIATSDAAAKTEEAGAAVGSTFGEAQPFDKLGANMPSIEKLKADALLKGTSLGGALGLNFGGNISTNATPSAKAINASVSVSGKANNGHKVRLSQPGGPTVFFNVLPEITENHQSDYEAVAPAQAPGSFQKFKGTVTTTWVVQATFISRTSEEATSNYNLLNVMRGWLKPVFGKNSSRAGMLGAPPPVLQFSGLRNLIGPVPVVITSMNWNWPKDVDYIATTIKSEVDGNFIPFPVVIQIPINLTEAYSVEQFNNFSLEDYRAGRMTAAFAVDPSQTVTASNQEESGT